MRTKLVLAAAMAAVALPGIASAQYARELRDDRRDIRQEQRDLDRARASGDPRAIREERRDLREARQEYRGDWRDYRRSNRDVFRGGTYVGPRGYRYRPVTVGYRFAPAYYSQRYVIADPWRYRLPRPTGYNRWVRYGNDVVLVNVRNGRVITVYDRFFW